jgi:hypothetical protein
MVAEAQAENDNNKVRSTFITACFYKMILGVLLFLSSCFGKAINGITTSATRSCKTLPDWAAGFRWFR